MTREEFNKLPKTRKNWFSVDCSNDNPTLHEISIKGLNPRYKCYYDGTNLEIYNQKGERLGSRHLYNSEQTSFCLYCEDGKRRSFYTLRLLYAYLNNISVLDIPKGCIYRTKYGIEYYTKRKIGKRPLKEQMLGDEKIKYIRELDKHWQMLKDAIITTQLDNIANVLMQYKDECCRRVARVTGASKDIVEDCFGDAVEYYIKRIVHPKRKMNICMPNDALTSYAIKRYKTYYRRG